jgi:hypothetical protein
MSFAEFTNNKNKGVLWGILQEGGVFNNIPSSMFHNVKNIFEVSILSMKQDFDLFFDNNDEGDDEYDKKAANIIVNSNKIVIKKVIDEVSKIKTHNENSMKQAQANAAQAQAQAQAQQQQQPQPQQNMRPVTSQPMQPMLPPLVTSSTRKPKLEEIYRADDIKNTRMSELEIRLKEKQAEMDTMLNNKKPEHIDFSDKGLGINKESDLYDTKLASDEMERLLAQALASRERELDKLNTESGSSGDITNGNGNGDGNGSGFANKIVAKRPRESKNVTFNDADITKVEYEKQDYYKTDTFSSSVGGGDGSGDVSIISEDQDDTLSFYSKLKMKKTNEIERESGRESGRNTRDNKNKLIRIPLDDIMNMANRSDDESENPNQDMQLRVQEMHNFGGSRETRETREWGEMREMQKYVVLDQKIQGIQNDMNAIKKNQELILSILEKKVH